MTASTATTSQRDDESDEMLMLAYADGRAGAFDTLYGRHKGGVYRYVRNHCRNAGLADEMFQDVWMSVIRVRESYVATAKFATWLYTLAHNRLVDHWRVQGRATFLSIDDEADDDTRDHVETLPGPAIDEPENRATNTQIGARLKAALAQVPPAQRDAFLLQQEGGLSLAEIAQLTGVGVETVKSRLRYAVAKLRETLGETDEGMR